MRRKGEKPVPRTLLAITPSSPVMRMIADGDTWFNAWTFQQSTPLARLARMTGLTVARLYAIEHGDRVSRTEIDALARAWSVSADGLIGTLPDRSLVVD